MVIVLAIFVAVCVLKKKRKDNSEPEVGECNALLCNILLVMFESKVEINLLINGQQF